MRFTAHWNQFLKTCADDKISVDILESAGLATDISAVTLSFVLGPDMAFRVSGAWSDEHVYEVGRQGNELWIYAKEKAFGLKGSNDIPPFRADPDYFEVVDLNAMMRFPIGREQLGAMPALFGITAVESDKGQVFKVVSNDFTRQLLGIRGLSMEWVFGDDNSFPVEVSVDYGGKQLKLRLTAEPREEGYDYFAVPAGHEDEFQDVALSHLTKFFRFASMRLAGQSAPQSYPEGLIATHGKGRLISRDGMLILYVEGSPEEMGAQHGALLRDDARQVIETMLYGAGIARCFMMGKWFFGEIEDAQARLLPHMNPAYLVEMDALAEASGMHREEVRLGNFFPELFHCSGFAVFDEATDDGMLYHGRILDYMIGLGLEANAVIIIANPDDGYSWANIGYASFTGTVTAMNAEGVAIGEMGGGGWGDWDGKPMAQLMRETMERASTVEEGIAIFEQGPRTCEYYYVLSQANPNYAVGIYATPEVLDVVLPGVGHPRLDRPVKDTVLLSSGARYTCLVDRVEEEYGEIDAVKAWELMARPVAMRSNIQTALFRPETLDFWVANAAKGEVASAREPVQFNLAALLEEMQAPLP